MECGRSFKKWFLFNLSKLLLNFIQMWICIKTVRFPNGWRIWRSKSLSVTNHVSVPSPSCNCCSRLCESPFRSLVNWMPKAQNNFHPVSIRSWVVPTAVHLVTLPGRDRSTDFGWHRFLLSWAPRRTQRGSECCLVPKRRRNGRSLPAFLVERRTL